MKVLGIETATSVCSVALVEENKVLIEYNYDLGIVHSSKLLQSIKELFKNLDTDIFQIDGIAVSKGPGSFTGVRVGVTFAKGLAFASGKPIVGIPTLEALAYQYVYPDKLICPVIPSRKNEFYFGVFKNKNGKIERVMKERALPYEKIVSLIKKPTVLIGDIEKDNVLQYFPRASAVASLGLQRIKKGKFDRAASLVPLYVRKPEVKRRQKC